MTQNCPEPGNWSGVLSHLLRKSLNFKSTSESKELQDVILKDEERMGKIQEAVEQLRKGSRTKSILEDLGKPENSLKFSEESSRIMHEMGNIELYELDRYPEPSSAIHA